MNKTTSNLYRDAEFLFKEGLKYVDPSVLIKTHLSLANDVIKISDIKGVSKKINLKEIKRIIVIGAGKASAGMAWAIENILSAKIDSGIIVTKYGFLSKLEKIEIIEAGHPIPDENGILGASKIVEVCRQAGEGDLIINLLSGGASALLPFPVEDITLNDKLSATKLLLESGASIDELNAVRKHLSQIKGGRLAEIASPASVVTLIISDVIGDRLESIGSGITVPDTTTFNDCLNIIDKYKLWNLLPQNVVVHLTKGSKGEVSETLKTKVKKPVDALNLIIGNNRMLLERIKILAERQGYISQIKNSALAGEAKETGAYLASDAVKFKKYDAEKNKSYCFLYGGETTVRVKGTGKGGRNQELVLAAAAELDGENGIVILSGGTDGNDGPTDAAGGICNGETVNKGKKLGADIIKYIENNDSYSYLKKTGDLLITGPTNTNVMDIQIVLVSN